MKKQTIILAVILLLGFTLRFVAVNRFPTGFTPDEAAQGFTAYSILHTGHDEWGKFLPLNLRSFGDFKFPVYTYLTIPSIALFGLNVFAVRLPSVLFGTLAILFAYLLARKLSRDERIGLFAAFLLAISPWHLPLSRGAFEANLTVCFMAGGLYFLLEGLENAAFLWPASILLGLNLFTYQSARLVTPILILGVLFWQKSKLSRFRSLQFILPSMLFCLFSLVAGFTMLAGGGTRASDVAIYNPTDNWAAVSDRQYEAETHGFPSSLERIFTNKPIYVLSVFSQNYVSYLSLDYLFTNGAGEGTYGMIPDFGVLYLFEIVTVGFAFYLLFSNWKKDVILRYSEETRSSSADTTAGRTSVRDPSLITQDDKLKDSSSIHSALVFLFFWVMVAAVPAAIAKGFHAANRDAVAMPAWQIISAIGLVGLIDLALRKYPKRQLSFVTLSVVVIVVFFAFFVESYTQHLPIDEAKSMQYGWQQAVGYIRDHQNQYSKIVVSNKFSEPQAYISFFLPLNPKTFQQAAPSLMQYEAEGRPFLDELGDYQIGKFEFKEIPQGQIPESGVLYVGTPDELSLQKNIIYHINYPNGQPDFLFATKPTPTPVPGHE